MQAHLGLNVRQSLHQKVCRSHPVFDRAVGMFDQSLALAHRIRALLEQSVSRIEYALFFPTLDALGSARRALRLQWTG